MTFKLAVADVLDDNKNNPHFDMLNAVKDEAKKDAKKGAKALIIYNSSSSADNILFDKKDSSEAVLASNRRASVDRVAGSSPSKIRGVDALIWRSVQYLFRGAGT